MKQNNINRIAKRDARLGVLAQILNGEYQFPPGMLEILNDYSHKITELKNKLQGNIERELAILKDAALSLQDEFLAIVEEHRFKFAKLETELSEKRLELEEVNQELQGLSEELGITGEIIVAKKTPKNKQEKQVTTSILIIIGLSIFVFDLLMAADMFAGFAQLITPLENNIRAAIFLAITLIFLMLLIFGNQAAKHLLRFFEILIVLQVIFTITAYTLSKLPFAMDAHWFKIFISAFPKVLLGLAVVVLAHFFIKYKLLQSQSISSEIILEKDELIKEEVDPDVLQQLQLTALKNTLEKKIKFLINTIENLKVNPPVELFILEEEQKERLEEAKRINDLVIVTRGELEILVPEIQGKLDFYKSVYLMHFRKNATSLVSKPVFPVNEDINKYFNLNKRLK